MLTEQDINAYIHSRDGGYGISRYQIRNRTKKAIHITSSKLKLEQLVEVSAILETLGKLSEPENVYPLFVHRLKGLGTSHDEQQRTSLCWKESAYQILLDEIKEGKNLTIASLRSHPIYGEVIFSIGTVATELDTEKVKDNPFVNYHGQITDPETNESQEIRSFCPFPTVARKWIATYEQVLKKAKQEHPELF